MVLELSIMYIFVHQLLAHGPDSSTQRSASLNRNIGKLGRITGVKAMGGHLYWHECRVETILDV